MNILLNVLLLTVGFVATVAAMGGDTWIKQNNPFYKRITYRGWLAIGCLGVALGLGIVKEIYTANASDQSKKEAATLRNQLATLHNQLEDTKAQLSQAQEHLQNILRANRPSPYIKELITQRIVHLSNAAGFSRVHVAVYENTSTYEFKDDSGKRTGYIALHLKDITELSLWSGAKLDAKISDLLFGSWGHDDLENDWNIIHDRVVTIVSSIVNKRFKTDGLGGDLRSTSRTMVLFPIDRSGNKLSKDDIVFSRAELQTMLKLSPIERGAVIVDRCDGLQ